MIERLAALNASEDSLEFWGNDRPKCPHCGADFNIEDNDAWRLYDDDEHKVTCLSCTLDFTVTTRVTYSFSTDSQPDEDSP